MIIRGKGDIVAEIPERRTERGEGGESFHLKSCDVCILFRDFALKWKHQCR